ncbi:SBBP repeat-containing protein [bacterium]|nr:SBBP repeat-containing protein [bacterium]
MKTKFNALAFLLVAGTLNATTLSFSTYLGGSGEDRAYSLAVDGSGNAYIGGQTNSTDFPTTAGAYDTSLGGSYDAFVSKLNSTGTGLSYSTYLGGSGSEEARALVVDSSGNPYIGGYTESGNFPTTYGAFDTSHNGGTYDAFVCKLNSTGTGLSYSSFLGGSSDDYAYSLAVDGSGNAYTCGETGSSNFPTSSGAFDTSYNGYYDAFVSKLNSTGTGLSYSTFIGGSDSDRAYSLAVDGSGNAYIGGGTYSTNFPTTSGAFDTSQNGGSYTTNSDAFVSKLNSTGSSLVFSTYLGGNNWEAINSVALDNTGNVYVIGFIQNICIYYSNNNNTYYLPSNFPVTSGAYDTSFNGLENLLTPVCFGATSDCFVTKLNSTGSSLVYSTYLGGNTSDEGNSIAVDGNGNAYVTGYVSNTNESVTYVDPNYPTTWNAYDTSFNGNQDAFISILNSTGSALLYSTFLGSNYSEYGKSITVDSTGIAFVCGYTSSNIFPVTPNSYDTSHNGSSDVFVSRFNFYLENDSVAPSVVQNFRIEENNGTNLKLKWEAGGDEGNIGTASFYEIRYSQNLIDASNFSGATLLSSIPTPSASGLTDSLSVSGLTSGILYYFGIRSYDNGMNSSPLVVTSNLGKPQIISISDVGNDNGNQVRIYFTGLYNDFMLGTGMGLSYHIFRKVNPVFSPSGKNENQVFEALPSGLWDFVGTLPVLGLTVYTIVVPTLADSNSTGTHDFEFLVWAVSGVSPAINSVSNVVAAHSVDNLAPPPPVSPSFTNNGNGTLTASWNAVYAPDLAFYTIYAKFQNDSYTLLTEVPPTGFTTQNYTFGETPGAVDYFVGSKDINGNEGLPPFDRITSLEVEVVGNDVVLSWLGKLNAVNYKIYRSVKPDLTGSVQIGTYTANGVSPVFTDSGAAQNSNKYFYFVTWEN